ncbi:MAG: family 10 glycosylhydrolase, partial [Anaerolineae bacterium]|nr:family 10 glycosylhydrolase [Anaerolineae bacterium]
PPPGAMVEFRGLWVTRFNWMGGDLPATPDSIDIMVNTAADAGFNALLFQVRGTADAYYASSVEPWAARLTGELGRPPYPYWDPLERIIARAHERGMQVHAYINVYTVWTPTGTPSYTSPLHLWHLLAQEHGLDGGLNSGLQWDRTEQIVRNEYQWATPASVFLDNHLMEVTRDLVQNYDLDGIHLDRVRYAGPNASCDPVSFERSGVECFATSTYGNWQRAQVNGTVQKFYESLFDDTGWAYGRRIMLSAAVFPLYESGRINYYQDSKAWIQSGYIDALVPMIYSSSSAFDATVESWRQVAQDFYDDRAGRFVFPGLGSNHYGSFAEIAGRIEASRSLGTGGHAIFSYGGLASRGYFDDLRYGPYAVPAVPPTITWHE